MVSTNPNFYGNNQQYNPYFNQNFPQQQLMYSQTQPQQTYQQPQQIYQGLNGKMVDSEEIVKVTEVPIGGYGVFPKADLSEVFIKYWNNNGTTSIISFKPNSPLPSQNNENTQSVDLNVILEKITNLENKIDSLKPQENLQKKEIKANDY